MNEIELLQKIKDAEQQLTDARRMLEDYQSRMPLTPKEGETYWFISSEGNILPEVWKNYATDRGRYATDCIFRTKDDAEREVRRRKTHQKLKEFAHRYNDGEIIELRDRHYLGYDFCIKQLCFYNAGDSIMPNTIYFKDWHFLDNLLEEISEDELIEYCKGGY